MAQYFTDPRARSRVALLSAPRLPLLWRLNEASGDAIQSGSISGSNLTAVNAPGNGDGDGVYGPSGLGTNARVRKLLAASSQYFGVSDNSDVSVGTRDFTAAIWVYPTSFGSDQDIIGQWEGSQLSWLLCILGGNFRVYWSADGVGAIGPVDAGAGTPNAWNLLVVTRNAATGATTLSINAGTRATATLAGGHDSTAAFRLAQVDVLGASRKYNGYLTQAVLIPDVIWSTGDEAAHYAAGAGRAL